MLLKGLHETARSLESKEKDTFLNTLNWPKDALKSSTNFPEIQHVYAHAAILFNTTVKIVDFRARSIQMKTAFER